MKQGLELSITLKQTLTLTPQLLQAVKVLNMTRVELENYIESELEENPALDAVWDDEDADGVSGSDLDVDVERPDERAETDRRAEDFDWAEYLKEKDYDDVSYGHGASVDWLSDRGGARGPGLVEFLREQLTANDLKKVGANIDRSYEIVSYIIDTLDENGFLTQCVEEMAEEIGAAYDEVQAAVLMLQDMEPAGVAASDVRESLVLQYKRMGGNDLLVFEIIQYCLADVAAQNIIAVSRTFGRKRSDVKRAFDIIAALDPKPGSGFQDGTETHYIIPDLSVEKTENGYEVRILHAYLPTLTVSPYYRKLLSETKKGSEEQVFLTERLNAAVAMIKSLEQREQTIYNIMVAILERQRDFFDDSKAFLKPMTLKQIADEVGVHESTVSRAARGKYVQTPRGVIEMKRFFCVGVKTYDGEGMASENVKSRIAELTAAENKGAPLSDQLIADLLGMEGVFLSRRTVAKYRNEAGIPSSANRASRYRL